MNFFVSYTTKDRELTIDDLNVILRKLKEIGNVYIDLLHNNSEDKQKRVFYELDKSDVIILVKTTKSLESEWVRAEICRANNLEIPIFDISLQDMMHTSIADISKKIEYLLTLKNYKSIYVNI